MAEYLTFLKIYCKGVSNYVPLMINQIDEV